MSYEKSEKELKDAEQKDVKSFLPDVDFEEMVRFYEDTGLDLAQVLAEEPSAPKVDPWKKFEHGKSLYNPEALGELGT